MKVEKLVYGVGRNDADYVVEKRETIGYVNGKQKQKLVWTCPFYQTWKRMLIRCYYAKYKDAYSTYKGCSVSEEWKVFSNFRAWMVTQDWEGKHLDKDLLFEGNMVYSENTCVFVTRTVNNFIIDSASSRGEWMIGVSWSNGKFRSTCSNPFTKRREHLGYFDSEQEAHNAWVERKLELAHELAAIQEDPRVAEALIARYSNYKHQ